MRPSGIVQPVCVTLVALAAALATSAPDAREAADVLCGYVAARNGHDFAKASTHAAESSNTRNAHLFRPRGVRR